MLLQCYLNQSWEKKNPESIRWILFCCYHVITKQAESLLVFIKNTESAQSDTETRPSEYAPESETFKRVLWGPRLTTSPSTQPINSVRAPHVSRRWHGGSASNETLHSDSKSFWSRLTQLLFMDQLSHTHTTWESECRNECGSTSSGENRSACVVNICVTLHSGGEKVRHGRVTSAFSP